MIALLSMGLLIAVLVFFGLRFLRLGNKAGFAVAGLVFIAVGGFAFYAFSRIDQPPPGSRTVTRDELLRPATANPSNEIAEPSGRWDPAGSPRDRSNVTGG